MAQSILPGGRPQITPKYRWVPTYGDAIEGDPEEAALISMTRIPAHANEKTAKAASPTRMNTVMSRLPFSGD